MIKIKIYTSDFHTFHPYRKSANAFRDIGIDITEGDSYDIALVGHSLFSNKKTTLAESTDKGLEYLRQFEGGNYILVDGQDSHSLIGTFDVFKESNAKALLKHSLLKDRELYKKPWIGGRYYWGSSDQDNNNYSVPDIDQYNDRILLSGTNWIGVPDIQWPDYRQFDKMFDVSGMFQFPHPECHEHDLTPSQDYFYNDHRQPVIDILNRSPFMVAKLYKGRRVPQDQYYKYISQCKVLLAPFGYGEMAPRDLESAQLGSLLIKPTMKHVDSEPFVYEDDVTYIPCKHDYSDLEEKIEYAVLNFDQLQDRMVTAMREKYTKEYHSHYLPIATAKILSKLGLAEYEE